ncbi:MAG TPA: peptidylprolyl isomerase [Thermoanaerobaculia bacterium]|nr:peptidylprolyl isomerase [Thermoanaerobaculia bacterium]
MIRRSKPSLLLPALALAVLTTGLAGCKKIDESAETQPGEAQTGEQAPGAAATAPESPFGAAPGTPGQPGAAPSPEAAKPVDPNQLPAVVARVNGEEIKKQELVDQAQEMRQQLARLQGIQAPLNSAFYNDVLNSMVANRLLLQEAKTLGLMFTDAEIEAEIQKIKSGFPNEEAYRQQLATNKVTEAQLRNQMRSAGTVDKLIRSRIAPSIQVSEADARAFYDKNQEQMKQPPRVHLRHILIKAEPNTPAAERQKARQKAEDLLSQVKNGGDFAALATANSDDPGSKPRGGDLSWVTPGQTVPAFEKAAFALKNPNDLSPVVETRFGFHIIQLLEREAEKTVPFEQAKDQIGQMLRQQQGQEKLRAHVEELKAKGKVETFL